jgi:MYXO-CTERM domain-containing protein
VFFEPRVPQHPILGVPVARLVLGQSDFAGSGAGATSAHTVSGPYDIAADATGRTVLVSDAGNNRVLRVILNQPPVFSGDGTFEIERGETLPVSLQVIDPENDAFQVTAVPPVPAGASVSGTVVTYTAPLTAIPGAEVYVTVTARDNGPRPQSSSATVIFRVVVHASEEPGTQTPSARELLPRPDGCVCSSAATGVLWLLVVAPLWRRRRR